MIIELTPVPQAVLPIPAFRGYLRLGSGFADDALQDEVLETALRGALALVERRSGVAVLNRAFRYSATRWQDRSGQVLPIAPVTGVTAVRIVDAHDTLTEVSANSWRLEHGAMATTLRPLASFPPVPRLGRLEIDLLAGFGSTWDAVPADLAQAVFLQAARYYELRGSGGDGGAAPGVLALLEGYRPLRAGFAGAGQ